MPNKGLKILPFSSNEDPDTFHIPLYLYVGEKKYTKKSHNNIRFATNDYQLDFGLIGFEWWKFVPKPECVPLETAFPSKGSNDSSYF